MNLLLSDQAFLVTTTSAGSVVYDPDAAAYFAAVEAADTAAGVPGGLENLVKAAVNDFILACKDDGTWTSIKSCAIMAGARTLNGALVPLIGPSLNNFGFTQDHYDRKTGLLGGPADNPVRSLTVSYLNTVDPLNKHMSVYCTEAPSLISDRYMIGTRGNAFQGASSIGTKTTGNTDLSINTAYTNSVAGSATLTGFLGVKRTNTTSIETRTGGVTISHSSSYLSPTSISFHSIFGRYLPNSSTERTDARLAFFSIGTALNLPLLDLRISTLINTLGSILP